MTVRAIALLILALALQPGRLAGQQVRGTVRDSATARPLPGALVMTLDSLGRTLARSVTDQRGDFHLGIASDVRRMRVMHMGFRPQERALALADAAAPVEISLASIPFLLEPLRATASASCARRADRGGALALLEQVRTGLLSTIVARTENRASMKRLLFERRIDGRSDRILSQAVRVSASAMTTTPFGAERSAEAFVHEGFMADSAGMLTFYAPDAGTLMDERFAEGYCFHVVPSEPAHPNQLGLGFEAARGRNGRIDIAGTLWVDTAARALRVLDFRYVGLDRQVSALMPGGRLSFRELANGVVVIDQWSLRLVSGRTGSSSTAMTSTGEILGRRASQLYVQETGGELARAQWPDGTTWDAPLGALRLYVVDHRGRPSAGVVVQLVDTDYSATTDSSGALEMKDLLPGPYVASIADPQLAMLGVPLVTSLRFDAVRDSTVEARLGTETAADFAGARCAKEHPITGGAWLLGRIVTPDGQSVDGARWTVRDRYGSVLVEGGRVNGDGLFQWCQFPLDTPIEIEVWRGDRRAKATRILTEHLTVVRLEIAPS